LGATILCAEAKGISKRLITASQAEPALLSFVNRIEAQVLDAICQEYGEAMMCAPWF